jgi:microcystin-dependent protein
LSSRRLGSKAGTENVTLTVNQIPSHTHGLNGSSSAANSQLATGKVLTRVDTGSLYRTGTAEFTLNSSAVANTGGSSFHTNLMPYLCVNYIIALFGIYPSRQ